MIFLKINLLERLSYRKQGKERKKQRFSFYQLTDSSNVCSNWGWASQKPGTCNLNQISYVSGRAPSMWAIFCCLTRCISRELDLKNSQHSNQHSSKSCWYYKQNLNSGRTLSSLVIFNISPYRMLIHRDSTLR